MNIIFWGLLLIGSFGDSLSHDAIRTKTPSEKKVEYKKTLNNYSYKSMHKLINKLKKKKQIDQFGLRPTCWLFTL